jgi:hypothetical protein
MTSPRAARHERLARCGLAPIGLSREEAATYIGVSPRHFDGMVCSGAMPPPKIAGERKLWSREALDRAFADLPDDAGGATHAGGASGDIWDQARV